MGTSASNLLKILAPVSLPKCAPNEPQRVVLLKLQTSLFASMAAENNHIMEEIWTRSSLFPNSPYEQVSEKWRSFGFQNNNPISDVRGGGELSMRCLLRFVTRTDTRGVLQTSIKRRELAIKSAAAGPLVKYESYPLSTALVNMTRFVASVFCLLTTDGMAGKKTNLSDSSVKGEFFSLLGCEGDFFDVVCDAMLILDSEWIRQNATYMDFPQIFSGVKEVVEFSLRDQIKI